MTALRPITRDVLRPYDSDAAPNTRLNGRKIQPRPLSIARASQSFGASWLLSSRAASAGDSVSELKAEMTVEIEIVSANCL